MRQLVARFHSVCHARTLMACSFPPRHRWDQLGDLIGSTYAHEITRYQVCCVALSCRLCGCGSLTMLLCCVTVAQVPRKHRLCGVAHPHVHKPGPWRYRPGAAAAATVPQRWTHWCGPAAGRYIVCKAYHCGNSGGGHTSGGSDTGGWVNFAHASTVCVRLTSVLSTDAVGARR